MAGGVVGLALALVLPALAGSPGGVAGLDPSQFFVPSSNGAGSVTPAPTPRCARGKYKPMKGLFCFDCPAGKYSTGASGDSSSCGDCSPGHYGKGASQSRGVLHDLHCGALQR